MEYLTNSEAITGYKVKILKRDAFKVTGFTLIVPPGRRGVDMIPQFWKDVASDGRLGKLTQASSIRPWVLGLGSWDPECEKHGQRYTICIEETEQTDFSHLAEEHALFTMEIGATDWMCFEMTHAQFEARFWRDNPYKMMPKLGYQFNMSGYGVGIHFDAYPPDYDPNKNPTMEFWITIVKP
jgi:predicted transcriptional regulator YdeE